MTENIQEEINLLAEEAQKEEKASGYRRQINMVVVAILLFFAAIIAGFFGYSLYLVSWQTRIDRQMRLVQDKILSPENQRKEITRRSLVGKLAEAKSFASSAIPFSTAFAKLIPLVKDSGVSLGESSFKGEGKIIISGKAAGSDNFAKFVEGLTNEEMAKTFDKVNLTSLTFSEKEKAFSFTIQASYSAKSLFESFEEKK